WHARVLAHGPMTGLAIDAEVTPPRGRMQARAQLALSRWSFELSGDGIDPSAAFAGAPAMELAVSAHGKGDGGRGTIDVTQLIAQAPGAKATVKGRVDLGPVLGIDARAHVDARDLAKLRV